ncbi:MAG: hypothetical protein QOF37_259 [Thermoleophilaceae bacterium]|nr:hypothetical protein [Thermoleophilaceae bacterium]
MGVRPSVALPLLLLAVLAGPGSAAAATQLGQVDPAATDSAGGYAGVSEMQVQTGVGSPPYAATSDGVITSWSINAGTGSGQAELRLYRATSSASQYVIAGVSGYQTLTTGRVNTFPTQIPVQAGDKLGLKINGNPEAAGAGGSGDIAGFVGDGSPGTSVSLGGTGAARMNESAVLEPDADRDGFGDETQDQCPSDPTTQGPCADLAVELTAPGTVVRDGKVEYTVLVRNTSTTAGAADVTARLALPPSLQFVPGSVSTSACSTGTTAGHDEMTCNFGGLAAGASATARVKASALTLGTSVAQAAVSYRAVDPNPANDTASATTRVTHDAVRRCPAANFVGGTSGNDRLTGSRFSDPIYAGTGNDVLFGLAGDDCLFGDRGDDRLFGGPGNDRLTGSAGRDVLHGGSGRDRMFGGASSDRLYGDAGNDTMDGGPGVDRFYGGPGNDKIMAADHTNETVDCGPGPRDSVTADPGDTLRGCERVRIRR